MIVIIGGMYRSGSTFSFNVAKEVLAKRGSVHTIAENCLTRALSSSDGATHLIVKTHAPDQLTTDLIKLGVIPCICTIRRPEDAISSWMRVFGHNLNDSISIFEDWFKWYNQVSRYTLRIDYDAIDFRPLLTIIQIQKFLTGQRALINAVKLHKKYDKRRLKEKLDSLKEGQATTDIGFSYYDNETFFHRRHISSDVSRPALSDLTIDQIAEIRNRLKEFVDNNGALRMNQNADSSRIVHDYRG